MRKTKGFSSCEQQKIRELLHEKTGVWIRASLLNQIFTRRSYSAQCGGENNEVLEFVGDQVLSFYVTKAVLELTASMNSEGDYAFRLRENQLTMIKQELVCNDNLCRIIDSWGIAEYIVAGRSEWPNGLDDQPKARADLFEAILGAIALEYKWDSAILEKAVGKMLSLNTCLPEKIKDLCKCFTLFDLDNAVQKLKEFAESGQCTPPQYEFTGPEALGYDKDGNARWVCACTSKNARNASCHTVWDKNKGLAKKTAAYLVLCELFEVQNAYGPNRNFWRWHWKNGRLVPESPSLDA